MSLETLTAARIYKAQQYNEIDCNNTNTDQRCYGEETLLDFEKFPHTGFSKVRWTYLILNIFSDLSSKFLMERRGKERTILTSRGTFFKEKY